MKTKIMAVLLIMTAVGLKAQEYIPLVAEGNRWNVMFSDCWYPPEPQKHTTTSYKIEGDSLFEGVVYKKVLSTKYEELIHWNFCGLIRENEEKQVYYRRWGNGHFGAEGLMYDYSLQLGDSIPIWNNEYNYLYLQSVNDTVLEDGKSRKKYNFSYFGLDNPEIGEFWIEGVGSQWGFPGVALLNGGTYELLCFFSDEELVWHNPYQGECFYTNWDWNEMEENAEKEEVTVFPNPVKEKLSIKGIKPTEVRIYNAVGQLVKTIHDANEINVSILPVGVYLLCVTDAEGVSVTKRITVSR